MPHATTADETQQFSVNDGLLRREQVGYLRASRPDEPLEELRSRYAADGYIFLKGLLPRPDVLKAREEYFKLLAPSGVLKPGTSPVEGIFDDSRDPVNFPGIGATAADDNGRPGGPGAAHFVDLALQAHTEDWYKETFCKHPALCDFIARFTGWGLHTLAVCRTLLRNNTPGNNAIGVHYDQIFLRGGEDTSVTAWVPMGDIALDGGGLIYLENGHKLGEEIEEAFAAKAEAGGFTPEEKISAFNRNMMSGGMLTAGAAGFSQLHQKRWLVTAYEAGDVVLHNPYTIHASTINRSATGAIRLGTDLRFVDSTRSWDTRWGNDFRFGDGV